MMAGHDMSDRPMDRALFRPRALARRWLRILLSGAFCLLGPAAAAEPSVPPDRSLTIEGFVAIGVPSIEREWTWDDVIMALEVLAATDPHQLPRAGSPKSEALFERLRQSDLRKHELSLVGARSPEEVARRSRSVLDLYRNALLQGLLFDREILLLLEQDLRRSAELLSASVERRKVLERSAEDPMRAEMARLVEQDRSVFEGLQDLHSQQLGELVALALLRQTRWDVRRDLVALLDELAPGSNSLLRPQQLRDLQDLIVRAAELDWNAGVRAQLTSVAELFRSGEPSAPDLSGTPDGRSHRAQQGGHAHLTGGLARGAPDRG